MNRRVVISALSLLAVACSPLLVASSPERARAAKEFQPTPDKTTIYVFRDKTSFENSVSDNQKLDVMLDGEPLGVTRARTFLVTVVEPGPHTLLSMADESRDKLGVVARPGEILYVYQEVGYVVGVTTRLHLVSAADAQPRIRGCDLVPSAPRTPAPAQPARQPAPAPGS